MLQSKYRLYEIRPTGPARGQLHDRGISEDHFHHSSSQEGDSRSVWSRQLSPHFKPDVSVKASGACGIWTNCWLPWLISTPSGVAICLPEIWNIDQPKQLQLRSCRTFTRRQMRAPSPFSAFSTSVPRSDTVAHRILLDRLKHDYGVGGLAIQWIESYLTGRSQFVRYNKVTSKTTSHLRCAAGVRPGADPLHILLDRSRCHRSASGLQSTRVHRWPTNIWIDGSKRCCWSDGSYVVLYRVCCVMDELKSTPAQSIQNRVDLARYQSPITALRRIQHDSL